MGYALRTRYDETIRSLEAAFAADQLHFQFYETLFSAETIRDITDFLGLRFIEPDTETRVNASPQFGNATESLQREIAEFYGPDYEFCAARFGANLISRIWPSYRFVAPVRIARAG